MSIANDSNDQPTQSWLYEEEYCPPFLPALILFPPIAPFFWKYHVRVSESTLSLGYSISFHNEIDRKLIQQAEVIEHINGMLQWGGWGYRLSLNLAFETGYISKNGPGIRLTYKTKEGGKDHVIVFNCDDAAKVCQILNTPVISAVVH